MKIKNIGKNETPRYMVWLHLVKSANESYSIANGYRNEINEDLATRSRNLMSCRTRASIESEREQVLTCFQKMSTNEGQQPHRSKITFAVFFFGEWNRRDAFFSSVPRSTRAQRRRQTELSNRSRAKAASMIESDEPRCNHFYTSPRPNLASNARLQVILIRGFRFY